MQLVLFILSTTLGVVHSLQIFPDYVIYTLGTACALNILALILESFRYPDLAQL